MKFMQQLFEFIFITVILKAIIVHALADYIMKYSEKWFKGSERHMAIWMHYKHRAQGVGHGHKHVLDCSEGQCAILQG